MAKQVETTQDALNEIEPIGSSVTLLELGKSIRHFGDVQLGNHLIAHAKAWDNEVKALSSAQSTQGANPAISAAPEFRLVNGQRPQPGDIVIWYSYPTGRKTKNAGMVMFTKESVEARFGESMGPRDAIERLGIADKYKRRFDSNDWNLNGAVMETMPPTNNPQAKPRLMMPQSELMAAPANTDKAYRERREVYQNYRQGALA